MKKTILAVIAVFVTWSVLDFVIHNLILGPLYLATPELWRPMDEMKMGLMYFTVLVAAAVFVFIYAQFITEKGIKTAMLYGLVYGIGAGTAMGFGTHSVMPTPCFMAFVWFGGTVVETVVAGLVTALIIKK
jgi:hypothetical protein